MFQKITSPGNPLIKSLKSLHAKKGRAETGWFLAEGARLIAEGADLGVWPEVLLVSTSALERPAAAALARRAADQGVRCIETSETILGQIARRENPQTMLGAFQQFPDDLDRLNPRAGRLWVALDTVRDPGNLGTIWRTADAAGAGGLILIGGACDPFSVEAVRATMGSLFAVPLARCDFASFNAWRLAGDLRLIGASLKGSPEAMTGPAGATVILLGNEQQGLPADIEAACDDLVRIPMRGRADSLNLAAAAAVLTFDVWRRQGYEGAR